jgi:four helix bundle protein
MFIEKKWRVASDEWREHSRKRQSQALQGIAGLAAFHGVGETCLSIGDRFPADEKFGLTAMIRRSAVLIPSSIAKGQTRHETRDFLTQLSYADGYLAELETQLLLGVDPGFCKEADVEASLKEIDELQRMLSAITRKLGSNSPLATRHSSLLPKEKKDSH